MFFTGWIPSLQREGNQWLCDAIHLNYMLHLLIRVQEMIREVGTLFEIYLDAISSFIPALLLPCTYENLGVMHVRSDNRILRDHSTKCTYEL